MDDAINLKEILESNNYWVVLDTNILLNIYRYSPEFTEFALTCLKSIEKWVKLPSTVRLEYGKHCRREFSKMAHRIEDAGADAQKQIEQARVKVINSCNNFERLCFPDVAELKSSIEKGFNDLAASVNEFFNQRHSLQLISRAWDGKDLLKDFVSELEKAGKIMPALTQEELYQWCEDGEKRYKKQIPPGFKDTKDKDGIKKYSDLFLWKETFGFCQ